MPSTVVVRGRPPTCIAGRPARCDHAGVSRTEPTHRRRGRDPPRQPQQVRVSTTRRGVMRLDRRLFSATVYPADYGFVARHARRGRRPARRPGAARGAHVPGLLGHAPGRSACSGWTTTPGPTPRSSACPPATPAGTTSPTSTSFPSYLAEEIEHFFEVYKDLEPGKVTNPRGYEGVDAAWDEIEAARRRYVPPCRALNLTWRPCSGCLATTRRASRSVDQASSRARRRPAGPHRSPRPARPAAPHDAHRGAVLVCQHEAGGTRRGSGSSSSVAAAASPPPITTTSESRMLMRLATPSATHQPKSRNTRERLLVAVGRGLA